MRINHPVHCLPALFCFLLTTHLHAQRSPVQHIFPQGTVTYSNIAYANDTLSKHLLDIYLPPNATAGNPLLIWIHGGGWNHNDKYSDMSYMPNTIRAIINKGYAIASIDYRYSTTAVFPAQLQDCNQAITWLYNNARDYKIDKNKMAVIGFSAGGHLASLVGLAANNNIKEFYSDGKKAPFTIKCVLDFYGPSDLMMMSSNPDTAINNSRNPIALLLGAMAVDRPDLAKRASPATYVDKNDPPFLIVQGEKDESVPNTQSKALHSWLTLAGVKNQFILVPNAPHYGDMFDVEEVRNNVIKFLDTYLK
jgi:acetyl esterase/lipase